jgi:4-amino-4-deoxy-L-arabinose transferase-like glycosyltransferase
MRADWIKSPLGTVCALIFALTLLRVVMLLTLPFNLYPDEAQYWTWSSEPSFGYFSKPPLIAWLLALTTSVCGDGEACVRLGAPLIHGATALLLYFVGRAFYDERSGFWAALLYASLPAVVFSSLIVSTDVPLLFFWTVALFAFWRFLQTKSLDYALALGVTLGLGLMSKYAMVYFLLSAALYVALTPQARWLCRSRSMLMALCVAFLIFLPNLLWNVLNGGVTFLHTASNAGFTGGFFHPDKLFEFLTGQISVFGPLAAMLVFFGLWRRWYAAREEDRFLLFFSVPLILIVAGIALASRANANWAAPAYIGLSLLAAAWAVRYARKKWRIGLIASHGLIMMAFFGILYAPDAFLPREVYPFHRVLGWDLMAAEVHKRAKTGQYSALLTADRDVFAELAYYLPSGHPPIVMWSDGRPRNHYQLTSPLNRINGRRPLLVSLTEDNGHILSSFTQVEYVGSQRIALGPGRARTVRFYVLSGFKGDRIPGD